MIKVCNAVTDKRYSVSNSYLQVSESFRSFEEQDVDKSSFPLFIPMKESSKWLRKITGQSLFPILMKEC